MVEMPRVNTSQQDILAYDKRRDLFLQFQLGFKSGNLNDGIQAINLLTQMYYCLPAARHIQMGGKDMMSHEDFINKMDDFRKKVIVYGKRKAIPQTSYLEYSDFNELDNEFDSIVKEFYKIMFTTGFSP